MFKGTLKRKADVESYPHCFWMLSLVQGNCFVRTTTHCARPWPKQLPQLRPIPLQKSKTLVICIYGLNDIVLQARASRATSRCYWHRQTTHYTALFCVMQESPRCTNELQLKPLYFQSIRLWGPQHTSSNDRHVRCAVSLMRSDI